MAGTTAQAVAVLLLVGFAAFVNAASQDHGVETEKKKHNQHHKLVVILTTDDVKNFKTTSRDDKTNAEAVLTDPFPFLTRYNMSQDGSQVGTAVLSGVAVVDEFLTLSAQLSATFTSGKYSGATVVAAGILVKDTEDIIIQPDSDTLLITAASKQLRGVEGSAEFAADAALGAFVVTFNFAWKGSGGHWDY